MPPSYTKRNNTDVVRVNQLAAALFGPVPRAKFRVPALPLASHEKDRFHFAPSFERVRAPFSLLMTNIHTILLMFFYKII